MATYENEHLKTGTSRTMVDVRGKCRDLCGDCYVNSDSTAGGQDVSKQQL